MQFALQSKEKLDQKYVFISLFFSYKDERRNYVSRLLIKQT